jgi:hypothetical protein
MAESVILAIVISAKTANSWYTIFSIDFFGAKHPTT